MEQLQYSGGAGDGSGEQGGIKRERPSDEDYNSNNVKRAREGDGPGPETTIRVLMQSKDAGGIIGKGGQNIKRLRSEYNAVVNVPDTNASERILTITAPRQMALQVLRECLPKIGESKSTERMQSSSYKDIQLLVQKSQVGSIIGRAGFKIKDIRESTGAAIKVFSDCLVNSTERIVAISGSDDVILRCIESVLSTLDETSIKGQVILYDPQNRADDWGYGGGFGPGPGAMGQGMMGGPRGGGRGGRGGRGRGRPGLLGGPGGRGGDRGGGFGGGYGGGNMGGGDGNFGGPGGMGFGGGGGGGGGGGSGGGAGNFSQDVGGGSFDQPSFEEAKLMQNLQQSQNDGSQMQSSTQVTIPKDLAGSIIGKGGTRIKQIRSRCCATIKIDDPLPGSNDRVITITGTQEQTCYAQFLLQQSVRQYSGKKF